MKSAPSYTLDQFILESERCARDAHLPKGRPFEAFLTGPSEHFHRRTIKFYREMSGPPSAWIGSHADFVELVYAVLATWGMDSQKARLQPFELFEVSVRRLVSTASFAGFQGARLEDIDDSWDDRLVGLYKHLESSCKIMRSRSVLVGGSKLLHHLLPDVFPPMDRRYTLSFLLGLPKGDPFRISRAQYSIPDQDTFLKGIKCLAEVARRAPTLRDCVCDLPSSGSLPKVIDNAVMVWAHRYRLVGKPSLGGVIEDESSRS